MEGDLKKLKVLKENVLSSFENKIDKKESVGASTYRSHLNSMLQRIYYLPFI